VRFDYVLDETRIDPQTGQARSLPVRVWYPARRGRQRSPSAPYLAAPVQAVLAQQLPALSGLVDVDTHAVADAPAREHVRAVILALPGGGALAGLQTGQVIELASRGYAVLAFDLPHESLAVEQPDGSLIFDDDSLPFAAWKLDAQRVLDEVTRLVPGTSEDTPIGAFGHSRGAAAVADLMDYDPRVAVGVALDLGSVLFGDDHNEPARVATAGLDRPFALMCSLDQPCDSPVLSDFSSRLRAPHSTQTLEILHNGFNDFLLFNAEASRADPAAGASLEQNVPTGTADDLTAARRALRDQRRFLVEFFERYL
jgi:alpha-beta hydrolase superfamily lysophospholipase